MEHYYGAVPQSEISHGIQGSSFQQFGNSEEQTMSYQVGQSSLKETGSSYQNVLAFKGNKIEAKMEYNKF
jgi:hypothetical protein